MATAPGAGLEEALALVAWAEAQGRAEGARVLQVVERAAPGLAGWLARSGYREADALSRLRRGARREAGRPPPGLREAGLEEVGLADWAALAAAAFDEERRWGAFERALSRDGAGPAVPGEPRSDRPARTAG